MVRRQTWPRDRRLRNTTGTHDPNHPDAPAPRLTGSYLNGKEPTMRQRLLLAPALLTALVACGADWTQFRGPGGSGTSTDTGLPTTWSSTENVVWRTALPGPGTSSPIVVG